ncbi:MAG: molybdopterin dinucleotide binding domain-containing protein [Polyangiaceae bacterium]
MVRDAPRFSGISHERVDREGGLQWPCPTPDHPGTKFLHEGGVLRGKGKFEAVQYRPSAELPDQEYTLVLSTGRTLYHYNAATQTRRESGLAAKQPRMFVQIHPSDARSRGIAQGERVQVYTRRGSIVAEAEVTREVRPGCIWAPLHFAEARANLLTNDAGDAVTQTAEYKVCAAEVRKLESSALSAE